VADHGLTASQLAALRSALAPHANRIERVDLFGSRATGHARRASDIDLAISAPDATTEEWLEFTDALDEAPIIYEFDVVRTERVNNPRLIEKIAREGVSIYPESATT
jgi:predicted nucleotidyltransferase